MLLIDIFTLNLIFFYLCRRHRFIVGISIYINNNHLMNFVYNLSVNLTSEVVIFYKGLLVYRKKEIPATHIIANFYQITIFSHHILVDDPSHSKRGLNNIFYDFFFYKTKKQNKWWMSFFKVIMYRHVLSTRVSGKGTNE